MAQKQFKIAQAEVDREYRRFHEHLEELLRRPSPRQVASISLVFSDCAYVVFDRPKDAERFAVHAMRSFIHNDIAVVAIAIALLQELLVFARQVVLEDDAVDVRAFVPEAFGFLRVGAIEFSVMLQFARLWYAGTESLAVARVIVQTPRFQQIASSLFGQRDDAVVAVEADRLNQP